MPSKKLNDVDERAFHQAMERVLLTQFPNPQRTNCPGRTTLQRIAQKAISMRDPAIDHVGHCSPCFKELQQVRSSLQRKRLALTVCSAAAVLILSVIAYFGMSHHSTNLPESVQQRIDVAEIDLRPLSVVRGENPPTDNPAVHLNIPRGAHKFTLQLPVGAEEGRYEIGIAKNGESILAKAGGQATIESQITTLRVDLDTSQIMPGDYQLAIRHADFDWRFYPLTIH